MCHGVERSVRTNLASHETGSCRLRVAHFSGNPDPWYQLAAPITPSFARKPARSSRLPLSVGVGVAALLAGMAARHGLGGLSMGMSGDFEAAIARGATHVRVGSAIFGTRA